VEGGFDAVRVMRHFVSWGEARQSEV
jgi:hypothetical protein